MTSCSVYEKQLSWRIKQSELGKSTKAYERYAALIPKSERKREHPSTPDPYDARMSKRQFEGRIKAWRKAVKVLVDDPVRDQSDHSAYANCGAEAIRFFVKPIEISSMDQLPARLVVDDKIP